MAHPYAAHRENKVMHDRVAKITKGYAAGGGVLKSDDLPNGLSKTSGNTGATSAKGLLKTTGTGAKQRLDRPKFANGGRANGKTNVNVIVAPAAPQAEQPAAPPPMPAAAPPASPPPRPMMPPPGASSGPSMPPSGLSVRKTGGRVDGPAWKEGLRNGTKVSHTAGKNDLDKISTKPPITKKKGGRVYPIDDGAGSGDGRLEKAEAYGGNARK